MWLAWVQGSGHVVGTEDWEQGSGHVVGMGTRVGCFVACAILDQCVLDFGLLQLKWITSGKQLLSRSPFLSKEELANYFGTTL